MFNSEIVTAMGMAMKRTSSTIAISFRVNTSAADTFTQNQVDLSLSPLDNEVFVVEAIDLDVAPPTAIAATDTSGTGSLSSTSLTAVGQLDNTNVLARKELAIRAAGFLDGGVSFESGSLESPPTQLQFLGVIATNDFFIQCDSTNTGVVRSMTGKLYGYRAKADAATYAALVQSEVLSA